MNGLQLASCNSLYNINKTWMLRIKTGLCFLYHKEQVFRKWRKSDHVLLSGEKIQSLDSGHDNRQPCKSLVNKLLSFPKENNGFQKVFPEHPLS